MVEWLEWLSYGGERRHRVMAMQQLENSQEIFELGKDKAVKGEGWALPSISCAQDTVGLHGPYGY